MADHFPLATIADAVQLEETRSGLVRPDPTPFAQKILALQQLVVAYVVQAFNDWNIYAAAGERHDVEGLVEQLHIAPRHRKLLNRWLNLLVHERLLARDGQIFASLQPLPSPPRDTGVDKALKMWPEAPELVQCIKSCGENIRSILTGEMGALEFLFPAGSFNVTEAIYERSAFARHCNGLLAKAMEVVAKEWAQNRPLRVLEVGAGVGGTTKSLLPVLAPIEPEYVYTDISKVFLVRGGQKFSSYPFLSRKIFDAEKEPSAQGFQEGYFDIVVASNVLHATKDIRATMRHVRALLRPNGLLFLWELTENQTWLDMTFALLEGWARHSDDVREDRPTLSIPKWEDLMRSTGWPTIYHFPKDLSEAQVLGNTVFIAEAG